MKYTIPIKKEHYYKASLLIFNQLGLSLTELELNLLSTLFSQGYFIITREVRSKLRDILNIDQFTLNNYIKRLKDKGVLVKSDDSLQVNQSLQTKLKDKEIHITFDIYDS